VFVVGAVQDASRTPASPSPATRRIPLDTRNRIGRSHRHRRKRAEWVIGQNPDSETSNAGANGKI
jgi:hypothetical protein